VWCTPLQRPLELLDPTLAPSRPFWEARELPAALALQRAHGEILAELRALRAADQSAFSEYRSPVVGEGGAWKDFQLCAATSPHSSPPPTSSLTSSPTSSGRYASCRRDEEHCARCPAAAAAIAGCDALNSMVRPSRFFSAMHLRAHHRSPPLWQVWGSSFFSSLAAGTHLAAHCGPSNLRLRVHLGLLVPTGCRIRVGDEVREWKQGECLVFDDSYEHEVWHEGEGERVVLIADAWHPAVDLEGSVVPMLSAGQLEDLRAARRGEHAPVLERGYSTGEHVTRRPP
jgi:aspartate beta-hydroxylase